MKCNHKWVDVEDGTNDQFCVRCRKFAMQGMLTYTGPIKPTQHEININIEPPSVEDVAKKLHEQLSRSTMMAMHRAGRR